MPSADNPSEASRATQLMQGGAELAGACVGAAVGLIGGSPGAFAGAAATVAATRALRRLGSDLQQRRLSPRQRVRVGAAFVFAAADIATRLEAGEVPRSDGFFEPSDAGRSSAEELLEGVLQAAADAHEEQKVWFLGRLYASFAFDGRVNRAQANFLIRIAHGLTFQQLALLAVIWDRGFAPEAVATGERMPPESLTFSDELALQVDELERMGLVGRGEPGGTARRGGRTFVDAGSLPATAVTLTGPGRRLHELMDLGQMPETARNDVLSNVVRFGLD